MLPSGSIPLFFYEKNPLYRHSPADILSAEYPPAPLPVLARLASFYHPVKVLTSLLSRRKHTRHQPDNTHRQEKIPNIMIVIIIIISIRLIYILKNTHKNTV